MARADTDFLKDFTNNLLKDSIDDKDIADVVTFTEAPWGLNFSLLPAQKFILKCLYRMKLDNQNKYIPVMDVFCEETLYILTEEEFLLFLIKEGRTNIVSLEKYNQSVGNKRYNEMIVCAGRRGSKCRTFETEMFTTDGIIKTIDFLNKFRSGEKIGLSTFNKKTGKIEVTYDIDVEYNGEYECYRIESENGFFDETTFNHPYLVWKENTQEPQWIEAKDLRVGDVIACSSHIDTFGSKTIKKEIAKLLGYIIGDTNEISDEMVYRDFNNHFLLSLENGNFTSIMKEFDESLFTNNGVYEVIKTAPKDEVSCFLSSLFSAYGNIEKGIDQNFNISLRFKHKKMIYDIQKILLNFGILSKINKQKIDQEIFYTLILDGEKSKIKFCKEIDLIGKNKSFIELITENKENEISFSRENISPLICETFCNGEILWQKIKKIKNLGIKDTVAIEVKKTNIIADSIITHNTNLSSVIASYEIYRVLKKYNPQIYYGFPESEQIFFTCASVDSEGAVDLLNKIKSRFFGCPIFKDKQVGDGSEYLTLQTDYDIEKYGLRQGIPTIKINTGACASNGLRGKNSIMVILDEIAFFGDNENSKFSGTNVYNAVTPSCASFKRKDSPQTEKGDGLIVLISSPKNKNGIFWETYENSFKMSDDILMFKMYSALMNPKNDPNYLRMKYKMNPEVFDVEFGANFSTKSAHFICEKELLYDCVDKTKNENPREGDVNKDYYLAVDLAYKNDATSTAIVHKENDIYFVDYVNAFFPGASDVWDIPNSIYKCYNKFADYNTFPIELVGEIIEDLSKRFMIKKGIYDQWSGGYPLETYLYNKGLERIEMTSFGPNVNSLIVDLFESLLRDKKIRFWNCEPMIQEFFTLEVETVRNNFRKVQAPQQDGFHDDIFDAVSRAIYLCYINTQKTSRKVTIGAGSSVLANDTGAYMINQFRKSKNHGNILTRTVGVSTLRGIRQNGQFR